ncbi:MAG TPA: cation diffusion facilitator family transporter [Burkholderiales bacterium]|nr:cation diffusion facilitator family transporter [Burkholderiales bacterium]
MPDFPMAHDHGHHHGHSGSVPDMALPLALLIGYALIELFGGLWAGSLALVSDSGHMFSDALALTLALVASRLARRPVGKRHSYGLVRAEVIAALINGMAMLVIIVFIVVEAVRRLRHPVAVAGTEVIGIAFIGLLVNLAVAYLIGRAEPSINMRAALIHVLGDVLGSLAALIAGAVVYFTGWLPIDPILSFVIGALILASTLRLLRDVMHVLMEGVPRAVDLNEVGEALAQLSGVSRVHDLHIWDLTPGNVALSAHLEVPDIRHWPQTLPLARTLLKERFGIEHVTLQPEASGWETPPREAEIKLFRPKGRD